jgi:hypothetical protein
LEDVQPFRIREVPLWMLDAAACCKIQVSKCKVANVESLRELKVLLQPTRRIDPEFAIQTQHPCLLDAGGADVRVIEPTEVHPTRAVCSPESEAGLASPEAQQKVLRLLALLLRRHAARRSALGSAGLRSDNLPRVFV